MGHSKRHFSLALLVSSSLIALGCGADVEPATEQLKVGAAFTNLRSVKIYDRDGNLVTELDGRHPVGDSPLEPGEYYLDIRDLHGNGVFDRSGNLNFAPNVTGAELDLQPYLIEGHDKPLIMVRFGRTGKNRIDRLDEGVGRTSQPIHTFGGNEYSMRSRVVWEAARAMVGPQAANRHVWPTDTVNANHRYASEDRGAWSAIHRAYGTYHSCRNDSDRWNNIDPCRIAYGADDPYRYEVQNGWYKGGQCKSFSNLVIYRSGVHHGDNWSLRMLPPDRDVTRLPGATRARPGTLQAGDILRMPYGHSAIVVRVLNSNQAIVIDSNWMGGNGWENVSTHVMSFSGGGVSDLGNYYRLGCVYDGSC